MALVRLVTKYRTGEDPPTGRPAFFEDPVTLNRFLAAIGNMASIEDAALFAGVDASSAFRSLKRGRQANYRFEAGDGITERDNIFRQFYLVARRYMVSAKVGLIGSWYRAANLDWRAARAMLQVRFPDEYAPVRVIDALDTDRALPAFEVRRVAAKHETEPDAPPQAPPPTNGKRNGKANGKHNGVKSNGASKTSRSS